MRVLRPAATLAATLLPSPLPCRALPIRALPAVCERDDNLARLESCIWRHDGCMILGLTVV